MAEGVRIRVMFKNSEPKYHTLPFGVRDIDIYEISIQFWPNQIAVYIEKEGVPLKDFGGDFKATITGATDYLKRINSPTTKK